jgi:hypothetical protein
MKSSILFFILLSIAASLQGQKETTTKKIDTKIVNQKLTALQVNIQKLETTLNEAKMLMNELQRQKSAITELNAKDMLQLQQLLEKKSQLETMISNIIKAGSETQYNIANNLKAS